MAFTLLELLLVVVLISVLLGVVAPGVHGAIQAGRLRDAATVVYNRLTEARQLAVSLGTQTEVRIYLMPELSGNGTRMVLRKIQVLALQLGSGGVDDASGSPEFTPLSSPDSWSENIVISDDADWTSFRTLDYQHADHPGGRQTYLSFRIHPDGSTTLPLGEKWFLTLIERRYLSASALPKNFITLQVDPSSGRVKMFQPE